MSRYNNGIINAQVLTAAYMKDIFSYDSILDLCDLDTKTQSNIPELKRDPIPLFNNRHSYINSSSIIDPFISEHEDKPKRINSTKLGRNKKIISKNRKRNKNKKTHKN